MRKTSSFILILLITSILKVSAQKCDTATYAHAYWFDKVTNSQSQKIIAADDGFTYLFGWINLDEQTNIGRAGAYITKLNNRGTPLFTKIIYYRKDVYLVDAAAIPGGGFYICGRSKNFGFKDGEPWVCKLDNNANIIWSYGLGVQEGEFSRVIITADGGCALGGSLARDYVVDSFGNIPSAKSHATVVKLDRNGKMQWGREFYSEENADGVGHVMQLKDGNIIATGAKDGITLRQYFMMKMDIIDGHTIWQQQTQDNYMPDGSQRSDGKLVFHNNDYIYVIDPTDGSPVETINITVPPGYFYTYNLRYGGPFSDTEDLYFDYVDRTYVLLLKINNTGKLVWGTKLRNHIVKGVMDDVRSAALQKATGNILVTGSIMTDHLSSTGFGEHNTYIIGTKFDGKSVCSDTFVNKLVFNKVANPQFLGFGWAHQSAFMAMDSVFLVDTGKVQSNAIDCYSATCCYDTTLNKTVNICEGGSYTLPDGTVTGKEGLYSFILKRSSGCDSIIFITVAIVHPVKPNLGGDTCFIDKNNILLSPNASLVESYTWQDGSTDSFYRATVPGDYWVQAKNACGIVSDTVSIFANCSFPLYIPNAFTPNHDGLNDVFRIRNLHSQKLVSFSIYNRWGQLVFKTNDPEKGWDGDVNGTPVNITTTFVYMVFYKDLSGKLKYVKGTVNLIR